MVLLEFAGRSLQQILVGFGSVAQYRSPSFASKMLRVGPGFYKFHRNAARVGIPQSCSGFTFLIYICSRRQEYVDTLVVTVFDRSSQRRVAKLIRLFNIGPAFKQP